MDKGHTNTQKGCNTFCDPREGRISRQDKVPQRFILFYLYLFVDNL